MSPSKCSILPRQTADPAGRPCVAPTSLCDAIQEPYPFLPFPLRAVRNCLHRLGNYVSIVANDWQQRAEGSRVDWMSRLGTGTIMVLAMVGPASSADAA